MDKTVPECKMKLLQQKQGSQLAGVRLRPVLVLVQVQVHYTIVWIYVISKKITYKIRSLDQSPPKIDVSLAFTTSANKRPSIPSIWCQLASGYVYCILLFGSHSSNAVIVETKRWKGPSGYFCVRGLSVNRKNECNSPAINVVGYI